jgi:hypothetical protein
MAISLADFSRRVAAIQQLLKNQQRIINEVMVAAGRIMWAEFVQRIFVLGQDASGAGIGSYSRKAAYFDPKETTASGVRKPRIGLPQTRVAKGKRVPALSPVGKKGDTVFKNGKPHKTAYLKDGYAGLRKAYGRQNSYVDLNLTGTLFLSVQLATTSKGILLFFASQSQAEKAAGNEKRFGKIIFRLRPQEEDIFRTEVQRILNLLVRKIINGEQKV